VKEIYTEPKQRLGVNLQNPETYRKAAKCVREWSKCIITENPEALDMGHNLARYYTGTMCASSLLVIVNAAIADIYNNNFINDLTLLPIATLAFSQFIPFRYLESKKTPKKLVVSDSIGPATAHLLDKIADKLQMRQ